MDILIIIILSIIFFIVLYFIKEENKKLKKEIESKRNENIGISQELTKEKAEKEIAKNRIEELKEDFKERKDDLEEKFKNIANDILNKNSERNTEHIKTILNPLKENINEFKKTVKENYDVENRERASLKTQIKHITELNQKLSDDATNLTNALKGDKKFQGNWGEIQLETILEKSGLEKGVQFHVQKSLKTDEYRTQRPDIIIDMPDKKNLIIDSKVSLNAYERFCSSEDKGQKDTAIKDHIYNIKKHIKNLCEKQYADLYKINSPDFILMFIPIEPALSIAISKDSSVFNLGLENNIILVNPTNLMATMRTISYIWKQENQKQNVINMVNQCGRMYDKFEGFTKDLISIGESINKAKDKYSGAMNKLCDGRGNLISQAQKIKELGANTNKELDERLLKRVKSLN